MAEPSPPREPSEPRRRGRLKLYLGYAAGVGKTCRLLEEARAQAGAGVDVVVAFADPRGRPETAALLAGLEVAPRRRVELHGVAAEELDLEAVLARRPRVAVVDDVAHVNAPGAAHRRRYQDVLALLDAGVDVLAACDVQHLESLGDVVERVAHLAPREVVPDSFVRAAAEVVSVDLAVEDLRQRLAAGRIHPAAKAASAREGHFRAASLASLRELALREVVRSVERGGAGELGEAASQARQRVMVCIASCSPRAGTLMRRGSRLAGRLSTDWFVVYVETPEESPARIDATAQRVLHENIDQARELGAEVVRLKAQDPVAAILDFARSHGVGHILIGRSRQPWWRRVLHRPVPVRLVEEAEGLDVTIVSFGDAEDGR